MVDAILPAPIEVDYQDLALDFDGANVKSFLDAYETKAKRDGASEYDMAWQLAFFIRSDEVFEIVKAFDGFKRRRWSDLKVSMLAYWGPPETPQFTPQDLEGLIQSWSAREYVYWPWDYPIFWQSLNPIVSYLLRNKSPDSEAIHDLCSQAFFRVCRRSLAACFPPSVNENKTWFFDCCAATEFINDDTDTELDSSEQSVKDPNHANAASTRQSSSFSLVASPSLAEMDTSDIAQGFHEEPSPGKSLSVKAFAPPCFIEKPTSTAPEFEEEDQSFILDRSEQSTDGSRSRGKSNFGSEAVETTEAPSGCASASESTPNSTVRRPLRCYYCHCDGHRFSCCQDLRRDKKATLVEQIGNIRSSQPSLFRRRSEIMYWIRQQTGVRRHPNPAHNNASRSEDPSVPPRPPCSVRSARAVDQVLKKIVNLIVPGFSASALVSVNGINSSPAAHLRDEVKLCPSPPDLRSSRPLHQMAEPLISLRDKVKLRSSPSLTPTADPCYIRQLRRAAEQLIPPFSLLDEVKLASQSTSDLISESIHSPNPKTVADHLRTSPTLQDKVKLCSTSYPTAASNLRSSLQSRQMAEHAIPISDLCSSSQLRQAAELLIPPSSLRDKVKLRSTSYSTSAPNLTSQTRQMADPLIPSSHLRDKVKLRLPSDSTSVPGLCSSP
ncbi:hypothetical protein PTTG_29596 [Puccinia triticina 1-1 BBBD Race 1]|uniref:Uncharacterized protein n=1 Tax=Puccinia triticina (isolate 1-1 / race 1 (BBBD)) TaxID=630390 RepID=A0A180G3N5_PUCT1|nr:hypothetical protein PTTG_29596 [Puccinia triticina 1-1 BBBD Race 1]